MSSKETEWVRVAIEEARNATWPFGAVIVVDGQIVAQAGSGDSGSNLQDPTAHAEVNAIRIACKTLGIRDFTGKDAVMVASCEPCMMCLGAIWYAGIRKVLYGSTIAEMSPFSAWPDLAIPNDILSALTKNEFDIRGGLLKEEVIEMYKTHPFKEKK